MSKKEKEKEKEKEESGKVLEGSLKKAIFFFSSFSFQLLFMADKKAAAAATGGGGGGSEAQFVNDGSFMEKFKKLQEDSEEKRKKDLETERSEPKMKGFK